MNNNTVYEWILNTTFTASHRVEILHEMKPFISTIVRPGDDVLDLCCGSGFASFWFEKLGATVTGIDLAPYIIKLPREEATRRNSSVQFVEADLFTIDFGWERFDLITCFDSISDFPLSDFAMLGKKVASALKHGGRFVVKYLDGSYKYISGIAAREGVYQDEPERISYCFKEYLPEIGAFVHTIRKKTRGEEYERKGYIYTPPSVQLAMGNLLVLEQRIALDEMQFLDIFIKPSVEHEN
jgi:2-polyprenyl-3-methyl-5-hydroxy-6-metoxy-1,4-benzoquinol methylase